MMKGQMPSMDTNFQGGENGFTRPEGNRHNGNLNAIAYFVKSLCSLTILLILHNKKVTLINIRITSYLF